MNLASDVGTRPGAWAVAIRAQIVVACLVIVGGCRSEPTLEGGRARAGSPDSAPGGGASGSFGGEGGPQGRRVAAPLRWCLTPYLPSDVLIVGLQPMARALGAAIGQRVEVHAAKDYGQLVDRLVSGEAELATLSAFSYLIARRRGADVTPLAMQVTAGSASYQGYVVTTLADASTLADLQGKRFCWVDRHSTSGYVLPHALFRRAGLDPDTMFSSASFGGSHRRCMDRLLAGEADGAALFGGILSRGVLGVDRGGLRILAKTERVPNDLVVASPALTGPLREQVRVFLLGTSSATEAGRRLLEGVPMQGWVDPAPDAVFERLEAGVGDVPGVLGDGPRRP